MNTDKNICVLMFLNIIKSNFFLFEDLIQRIDHLRILGVTFDEKLNFKKHNNEKRDNSTKYVNLLKIFNNKRGGFHPRSMIYVHNALIKSRTTFAAPCLNVINSTSIKKTTNNSLRISLGMTRSTPITAILGDAAEWPIEHILKLSSIHCIAKHLQTNSHIGTDIRNKNGNHIFK